MSSHVPHRPLQEQGSALPGGEGGHPDGAPSAGRADQAAPPPCPSQPPSTGGLADDEKPWWFDCDDIILVDDPADEELTTTGGDETPPADEEVTTLAKPAAPPADSLALSVSTVTPAAPDRASREEDESEPEAPCPDPDSPPPPPAPRNRAARRRAVRARRKGLVPEEETRKREYTPEERLLLLDSWQKSGLPATDFAPLVGLTNTTLYGWRKRFEEEGPAGLENKPKGGKRGSRLPEPTKRAILMLKQQYPDWGIDRISSMLERSDGYKASPGAVQRVLEENGYVVQSEPTRPHPQQVRRFERATVMSLWQSDLFTFTLPRSNRRVHLCAFMDDHSRFILGFGLHASASGAMVREVFEDCITRWGPPKEVATDNGAQYHTWRGKSAFRKLCERRGVKHIVTRPRHPESLGKIERWWGTLWRECLEGARLRDIDDARTRVSLFVGHYNHQRPHSALGGLVPADRFFEAAPEVKATLAAQVEANALTLARHGVPRKPVYLTGRVGDQGLISVHAEGDRVILTGPEGQREEVDLTATGPRAVRAEQPPGTSPLDAALAAVDALEESEAEQQDSATGPGPDGPDDLEQVEPAS